MMGDGGMTGGAMARVLSNAWLKVVFPQSVPLSMYIDRMVEGVVPAVSPIEYVGWLEPTG
jgi:hypothetical protein